MVERIRQLCVDRGISLKRLELEAGIGNGVIARWESSSPRADKLLAVAKVLNVSAEYLLTGNENQPTEFGGLSVAETSSMRLSEHEKQVIIAYRSHPDMQEAVDRLLQLPAEGEAKARNA